jgi:hypothetical protein
MSNTPKLAGLCQWNLLMRGCMAEGSSKFFKISRYLVCGSDPVSRLKGRPAECFTGLVTM